ncbi:two-component system chemotaxis response regulator CheB [Rhodobacter sp. JA431]|uniref:chemotaxis-specific protein-glutamate methyltransferase CheB n=1 Tax=Rhodobacter sp. JA431 TaxID=570013 RepID=UPI000BCA3FFC|nr:chemotaxis-specific protein-glutamate methyltransferase CheB [Rhodobacter sp. JA431]SOC20498.1 two-component system chemotaxis response regulator CheB [Rhodobacter sp. JA431]
MRLLVVDDSALMRRMLQECFAGETDIDLLAARDGEDALAKLHSFEPDVITLDINMPKMDGLTCLAHIMEQRPCPVVMVSSLTERGALATFEALELGAVDYVAKPDGTVSLSLDLVYDELRSKVRAAFAGKRASQRKALRPSATRAAPKTHQSTAARTVQLASTRANKDPVELVVIGSSTGGPKTLSDILAALPADFPAPILIAQHMPPRFTRIYAERLAGICALEVRELDRAQPLHPGTAYIAQGAKDVVVTRKMRRLCAEPMPVDTGLTWHPSVSRMVASALEIIAPERLVGVMLTGMGDDGAFEMAQIHQGGGRTIAESEETAVVWGMPQQLVAQDGASVVLPCDRVAEQLQHWLAVSPLQRTSRCR